MASGALNLVQLVIYAVCLHQNIQSYTINSLLDAINCANSFKILRCMLNDLSPTIGHILTTTHFFLLQTALNSGNDGESLGVVIVCAILQALAVALARWAYLGFGWRMYSKIACDATLPDAEKRRAIGLRLGRFSAVAKLDIQLLCLLLIVGIVNGCNPSGAAPIPSLIATAAVGVTFATAWLAVCWIAVASARPNLSLAAEFTYPLCYIVAAAFMFSSVVYSSRLGQLHGQVYLIVYPILFVASQTWVWWDARLLAGSDIARQQKDFAAKRKAGRGGGGGSGVKNVKGGLPGGNSRGPSVPGVAGGGPVGTIKDVPVHIPAEILPLVHGAWLLKLPSGSSTDQNVNTSPTKRTLRELWAAAKGARRSGRWRYFQLSHDGSTIRWDWRKFVLLVHIESVSCCPEDLTITLSLTLEPDLRLKFPNSELHATWARGLTLLVMLLGNPDGLDGPRSNIPPILSLGSLGAQGRRGSIGSRDSTFSGSMVDPGSPNRVLYRLASASGRASAAGLLTKEALEYAAWQARKALKDCSQPPSPDTSLDGKFILGKERSFDLEKGVVGRSPLDLQKESSISSTTDSSIQSAMSNGEYTVISMRAGEGGSLGADSPRRERVGRTASIGRGGGVLRQRTPTRRNGTPPLPFGRPGVESDGPHNGQLSPSPSKTKRRREEGPSWLRRTLTAPANAITAGIQHATNGAARQLNYAVAGPADTHRPGEQQQEQVPYSSPFDVEAHAGTGNGSGYSPPHNGRRLFPTPSKSTVVVPGLPAHVPISQSRSRSLHRNHSVESNQSNLMPSVPEGDGDTYDPTITHSLPPPPPPQTAFGGSATDSPTVIHGSFDGSTSTGISGSTFPQGNAPVTSVPNPIAAQQYNYLVNPPWESNSNPTVQPPSTSIGNGVQYHVVPPPHHVSPSKRMTHQGRRSNTSSPVSAGRGNNNSGGKGSGIPRSRSTSPLKPPPLPTISVTAIAGGLPTGMPPPPLPLPLHGHVQQYQPAVPLARYASAPMFSLQRTLSGVEGGGNNDTAAAFESENFTGGGGGGGMYSSGSGLPSVHSAGAVAATLQRMGSDGHNWQTMQQQATGITPPVVGTQGGPGSTLVRYDSLGPQIAPGSNLWQAMFDAGMAYQMSNPAAAMGGGSREGSPSPSATPRSVTRSVAVNMELIDFEQLSFGRMLGEGAGKQLLRGIR